MAVDECALRARVSFWSAGTHGTWTAADRIFSRNAAISSMRDSNAGVTVNCGS